MSGGHYQKFDLEVAHRNGSWSRLHHGLRQLTLSFRSSVYYLRCVVFPRLQLQRHCLFVELSCEQ